MPDPREEEDIFDTSDPPEQDYAPDDGEVVVPNSAADQLVSSAISSMQRENGGPQAQRFLPRQDARPPARTNGDQPGQQPQQSPELQGILRELRGEREARQALEREVRESRQPKQPETPFNERIFQDPESALDGRFRQYVEPLQQQIQTFQTDMDFRMTRADVGAETFDAAYQAWFEQVGDPQRPDPQNYFAVMNAPDKGAALMRWYDGRQIETEVGRGGLKAYRERIAREALESAGIDPDSVLGKAPKAARNGNGQGNGRPTERAPNGQFTPRHEVRLPSSTSRMGHSSREAAFQPEDGSDEAIFDFGRAKRR